MLPAKKRSGNPFWHKVDIRYNEHPSVSANIRPRCFSTRRVLFFSITEACKETDKPIEIVQEFIDALLHCIFPKPWPQIPLNINRTLVGYLRWKPEHLDWLHGILKDTNSLTPDPRQQNLVKALKLANSSLKRRSWFEDKYTLTHTKLVDSLDGNIHAIYDAFGKPPFYSTAELDSLCRGSRINLLNLLKNITMFYFTRENRRKIIDDGSGFADEEEESLPSPLETTDGR